MEKIIVWINRKQAEVNKSVAKFPLLKLVVVYHLYLPVGEWSSLNRSSLDWLIQVVTCGFSLELKAYQCYPHLPKALIVLTAVLPS